MEALRSPSTSPALGIRANKASPVIIATDGEEQSDVALMAGQLFAGDEDATRLVTVLRPLPLIPEAPMPTNRDLDRSRRSEVQRRVIAQMTRTWGSLRQLEIEEGDPATVVASIAHRANATMIVAGLGKHRISDRIFGDETALRLIRVADVPVLAVAGAGDRAPERIVVACDFSEASLRAARMAVDLAASGASIYIAHVAPRAGAGHAWDGWGKAYRRDALDLLEKTRSQLRPAADMNVQTVMLQGDAPTELLAFASGVRADMIATGSHGHGFVARLLIGSVATRIVRTATISVLTVPRSAVPM